jgi:DNA-binding transcriptional LysR family regulator
MELRQLAYFVAVVDEAHFTRAAERLRIAQPAVSQQIRRLEAELGERLLHRDRRRVALTSAGEALLPYARAALAQAEHGRQAVAALRGLVTGQLRVGLVMPLPDRRIVRTIGAFGRKYPASSSRS